jgi:hypothetical protein
MGADMQRVPDSKITGCAPWCSRACLPPQLSSPTDRLRRDAGGLPRLPMSSAPVRYWRRARCRPCHRLCCRPRLVSALPPWPLHTLGRWCASMPSWVCRHPWNGQQECGHALRALTNAAARCPPPSSSARVQRCRPTVPRPAVRAPSQTGRRRAGSGTPGRHAACLIALQPSPAAAPAPRRVHVITPLRSSSARGPAIAHAADSGSASSSAGASARRMSGASGSSGGVHSRAVPSSPIDIPGRAARAGKLASRCGSWL